MLEADLAGDRREPLGIRRLRHARLGKQQVAELDDRRPPLLVRVVQLDQLLDRGEERVEVEDEGGQLADREVVVQHHRSADEQQAGLAQPAEHLGAGPVDAVDPGGVVVGVAVLADDVAMVDDVVPLAVVGGHDADARQALLEVRQHVGDAVPDPRVAAVGGDAEPEGQPGQRGHDEHHGHDGQVRVHVEEDGRHDEHDRADREHGAKDVLHFPPFRKSRGEYYGYRTFVRGGSQRRFSFDVDRTACRTPGPDESLSVTGPPCTRTT